MQTKSKQTNIQIDKSQSNNPNDGPLPEPTCLIAVNHQIFLVFKPTVFHRAQSSGKIDVCVCVLANVH